MAPWAINPTARIALDPLAMLITDSDGMEHRQSIGTVTGVDAMFSLAEMSGGVLDSFVREALASNDPAVRVLVENRLLTNTQIPITTAREEAFRLGGFRAMEDAASRCVCRMRDGIQIRDGVLPDEVRYSVDVWARCLPYRRLDVDHPEAKHLHWIHTLSSSTADVRAIPFLRTLDNIVRRSVDYPLQIFRAYVYSGEPSDVYHAHSDSKYPADVTAVYYPSRWEDSWGGELLFYDDGEPRWAVLPTSNRLIIFRGIQPHRIGAISGSAESARCSVVLRYGSATRLSEGGINTVC